ncbi:hypothetical protein Salat_2800600 [Sesamum alatum]|uniref:Uncharacterized protein n=1 Tax=Sesamum alatum TaxID=300844 RepID=A0AAE1XM17_9LAMI|nr:hypothetical protein Salat_2800600 [Sesamum alatum]
MPVRWIDDVDVSVKKVFLSFGQGDDLHRVLGQDELSEHENDRFIELKRLFDSTDGAENNRQTKRINRVKHGKAVLSSCPDEERTVLQTTTVLTRASDEDQAVFANTAVYSENSKKNRGGDEDSSEGEAAGDVLAARVRAEFNFMEFYKLTSRVLDGDIMSMEALVSLKECWEREFAEVGPLPPPTLVTFISDRNRPF